MCVTWKSKKNFFFTFIFVFLIWKCYFFRVFTKFEIIAENGKIMLYKVLCNFLATFQSSWSRSREEPPPPAAASRRIRIIRIDFCEFDSINKEEFDGLNRGKNRKKQKKTSVMFGTIIIYPTFYLKAYLTRTKEKKSDRKSSSSSLSLVSK